MNVDSIVIYTDPEYGSKFIALILDIDSNGGPDEATYLIRVSGMFETPVRWVTRDMITSAKGV